MKCLRCGYCCKHYFVTIVDDPEKGIAEDNLVTHLGDGTPCKHLEGTEPGSYACGVHSKPWYTGTPCYNHGQFETDPDTPCRVGEAIMMKLGKIK